MYYGFLDNSIPGIAFRQDECTLLTCFALGSNTAAAAYARTEFSFSCPATPMIDGLKMCHCALILISNPYQSVEVVDTCRI